MKEFVESILNLQKQASKDSIRYFLNGVCIDPVKDGQVRLRATDGHALAQKTLQAPEGLNIVRPYIVDPDSVKLLKVFYNANKKAPFVVSMNEKEKIVISAYGQSVTLERIDGDFPDSDRLWRQSPEKPFTVGLNPELLATLCDAMRDEKNQSMAVLEFDPENPLAAIKVKFGDHTGLLMPMRTTK